MNNRRSWLSRLSKLGIARRRRRRVGAAASVLATVVAVMAVGIASGQVPVPMTDQSTPSVGAAGSSERWIPTHDRVLNHEALPCTGLGGPTNFEVFSAGPSVAGLPLTATLRRCDANSPVSEAPANDYTYVYGRCTPSGETGCAPPLEIQTWPACQRNLGSYSFEGHPIPFKALPAQGGAKVVELDFGIESRVEVYTNFSTVVIFADSPELAREAVQLLVPQPLGKPPVTDPADLRAEPQENLAPPAAGAVEGRLTCHS